MLKTKKIIFSLLCASLFSSAYATQDVKKIDNKSINEKKSDMIEVSGNKTEETKPIDPIAPTLQINGYSSICSAFSGQNNSANGKNGSAPHFEIGASNLYLTAKGRSASALDYKVFIAFDTFSHSNPMITQNYIELSNKMGILQFGNLNGPSNTMIENALNLCGGAGVIDGTMGSVINTVAGQASAVNNLIEPKKSTKIVYYTPMLTAGNAGNLQLGFSYTPNTSLRGRESKDGSNSTYNIGYMNGIYNDGKKTPWGLQQVASGIKYTKEFSDTINMVLAAVYIQENSKGYNGLQVHNGKALNLSAALGVGRWRFASGFLNNFKSRLPKESPSGNVAITDPQYGNRNSHLGNAGKSWNLGSNYTIGAYQFALAYFNTNRKSDASNSVKSDAYSATVDFTACEGLKFYAEADYFKAESNDIVKADHQAMQKDTTALKNNKGTAFIVGAKVSF